MSFAILYRNTSGNVGAITEAGERVRLREFEDRAEALRYAEDNLAADSNMQIVELDEL